jgi:hypothetical protein
MGVKLNKFVTFAIRARLLCKQESHIYSAGGKQMKTRAGESDLRPMRSVLGEANMANLVAVGLLVAKDAEANVEIARMADAAQMHGQALIGLGLSQATNTVPLNWRGLREGQPIQVYDFEDHGGLL